jgi:hypothetical protein
MSWIRVPASTRLITSFRLYTRTVAQPETRFAGNTVRSPWHQPPIATRTLARRTNVCVKSESAGRLWLRRLRASSRVGDSRSSGCVKVNVQRSVTKTGIERRSRRQFRVDGRQLAISISIIVIFITIKIWYSDAKALTELSSAKLDCPAVNASTVQLNCSTGQSAVVMHREIMNNYFVIFISFELSRSYGDLIGSSRSSETTQHPRSLRSKSASACCIKTWLRLKPSVEYWVFGPSLLLAQLRWVRTIVQTDCNRLMVVASPLLVYT